MASYNRELLERFVDRCQMLKGTVDSESPPNESARDQREDNKAKDHDGDSKVHRITRAPVR